MRPINADALIALVQDSTILGDGFKQAFCALVNGEPTIEPERKPGKWNRLMLYLADLQLTYSPGWGSNGCGDQKLYDFITGLIEELEGWTDDIN